MSAACSKRNDCSIDTRVARGDDLHLGCAELDPATLHGVNQESIEMLGDDARFQGTEGIGGHRTELVVREC